MEPGDVTQPVKFNTKPSTVKELKEALFTHHFIATGGNASEAMRRMSPHLAPSSAEVGGHHLARKVKPKLIEALSQAGVTPEKIAKKVNTLLDAKIKVKTYKKGDLETEIEHVDHFAIDKGITQAMKMGLAGGYAAEKHVNLNLSLKDILEEIRNHESSPVRTE